MVTEKKKNVKRQIKKYVFTNWGTICIMERKEDVEINDLVGAGKGIKGLI